MSVAALPTFHLFLRGSKVGGWASLLCRAVGWCCTVDRCPPPFVFSLVRLSCHLHSRQVDEVRRAALIFILTLTLTLTLPCRQVDEVRGADVAAFEDKLRRHLV